MKPTRMSASAFEALSEAERQALVEAVQPMDLSALDPSLLERIRRRGIELMEEHGIPTSP